jgi:hypothetical protein
MKRLVVWSVLCAACAKGPHTPADIAGNIPVRIVNFADSAACELYIQLASDAQAKHDNLLGADYKLKRITSTGMHELALRPGTYNVGLKGCDGTWAAYTERAPLTISGPVEIRIGWTPLKTRTPPPPGFRVELLAEIPLGGGGYGGGGNAGGEGGEPSQEEEPASSEPAHDDCLKAGEVTQGERLCCSRDSVWPSDQMSYAEAAQKGLLHCK